MKCVEYNWTQLEEETVDLRREIHRYAELGGQETRTAALVKQFAQALDLPVVTMEGTGLVVILDTGMPGRHLALRADMDALPIVESPNNTAGPKACISDDPKTCHACGHDAHTAMLLCAMKELAQRRALLRGTVYFCFEQGEENRSGYQAMMDTLARYHIDSVWGMHVMSSLPSGKVGICPGAISTGVIPISFDITGKGGHSSRPDQCRNPLVPAAAFVGSAYTALYNALPPGSTVSMALTTIHCGTARNVIAESALVEGCMRYQDLQEGLLAKETVKAVAEAVAHAHGCTVSFHTVMESGYIPVHNDETCTARAQAVAADLWGADYFDVSCGMGGSESFGYYTERYPGVFVTLGTGNVEKGSTASHHHPQFDIDEDMLIRGVQLTAAYAETYLTEEVSQ